MSDDYTGGGCSLCDSDESGHHDDDEDDDDDGSLSLIPGMVVPPCLL
ncbi:hypothetical protein A2U01_0103085, partial [Trifolium medium]|nr:hypothetical protein [Trifolium medium]